MTGRRIVATLEHHRRIARCFRDLRYAAAEIVEIGRGHVPVALIDQVIRLEMLVRKIEGAFCDRCGEDGLYGSEPYFMPPDQDRPFPISPIEPWPSPIWQETESESVYGVTGLAVCRSYDSNLATEARGWDIEDDDGGRIEGFLDRGLAKKVVEAIYAERLRADYPRARLQRLLEIWMANADTEQAEAGCWNGVCMAYSRCARDLRDSVDGLDATTPALRASASDSMPDDPDGEG